MICKKCQQPYDVTVPTRGRWKEYSDGYCLSCWQDDVLYTVPYDDETDTWLVPEKTMDERWTEYVDSLDGPDEKNDHRWDYGRTIRECSECGERETYWDDEEYPINPCRAAWETNQEVDA